MLHSQLLELDPPATAPHQTGLYSVAYRTTSGDPSRLEVWPRSLGIDAPLPTMPLWLSAEFAVPVDLATSYAAACTLLRMD